MSKELNDSNSEALGSYRLISKEELEMLMERRVNPPKRMWFLERRKDLR